MLYKITSEFQFVGYLNKKPQVIIGSRVKTAGERS